MEVRLTLVPMKPFSPIFRIIIKVIVIDQFGGYNQGELLDTGRPATRLRHLVPSDVDQTGLNILPEVLGTETRGVVGLDAGIELEGTNGLGVYQRSGEIIVQFARVSDAVVDAL